MIGWELAYDVYEPRSKGVRETLCTNDGRVNAVLVAQGGDLVGFWRIARRCVGPLGALVVVPALTWRPAFPARGPRSRSRRDGSVAVYFGAKPCSILPPYSGSFHKMFDDLRPASPPPLARALEVMRRIWAVDHAARHLSRMMETHLGVTGPQRLVVRIVGQRPGVSPGELGTLLHLDPSTLTGHLQTLSEAGIIDRRTAENDARRAEIYLTPKGKRLDVQTPGTVEAAVEAALIGVTDKTLVEVERFLERLVEELSQQAVACDPARTTRRKRRPRRRR